MLSNSNFDHLVTAVPDLQEYVEQSGARLGVKPVEGGSNPLAAAAGSRELRVRLGEDLDFFGIALDIIALGAEEGETEGLHAHLKGPGGSWTL